MSRALFPLGLLVAFALALGAGGAALVRLANATEAKKIMETSWPVTRGELDELTIESSPEILRPRQRWTARYHYQVEGRSFTGFRISGIVISSRASREAFEQALAPLIAPTAKAVVETTPVSTRWIYTPAGQGVDVSYNPADPADATIIIAPPQETMSGARDLGWLLCAGGGLLLALALWGFVGSGSRDRATRPGEPAPSPGPQELADYTRLVETAIRAVEVVRQAQERPGFLLWHDVGSSLQAVRADPAGSLSKFSRLGYSRWLSEWEYEDGSEAVRGVDAAIRDLEAFHTAYWRKLGRGEM